MVHSFYIIFCVKSVPKEGKWLILMVLIFLIQFVKISLNHLIPTFDEKFCKVEMVSLFLWGHSKGKRCQDRRKINKFDHTLTKKG